MTIRFTSVLKVLPYVLLLGSFCQPNKVPTEPLSVDGRQLMSEYLQDDKEADKKYKNRQLQVSSWITQIRQNDGIIVLAGVPQSMVANGIECRLVLDDDGKNRLATLITDQVVVAEGKNDGYDFGTLHLVSCRIKPK
jgi:hypothetical protein